MDEKTLLSAPESEYMNEKQLAFFDKRLRELRAETLEEIDAIKQEVRHNTQVSDVTDRATLEEEAMLALRIADRKQQLIYKIDQARQHIRSGDYGYCLQSGEPIGIARLLIRPTAEHCTDIKIINERREGLYDN